MPTRSALHLSAHFAPRRARSTPVAHRWAAVHRRARSWEVPAVPTLVVTPHPDDESLTVGGLIARQRGRGVPVTVLAVTDGEAAYPDRRLAFDLKTVRVVEQHAALERLGVDSDHIVRLGIPDGAVPDRQHDLAGTIAELAGEAGLVVSPWPQDWHSDHEACGRAALDAVRDPNVRHVHSVFWGWHHRPTSLLPPGDVLAVELEPHEYRAREQAIACHVSQVSDDLTPGLLGETDLEPSRWPTEFYVQGQQ